MLRPYIAEREETYCCGQINEYGYKKVIMANSESEALGFALAYDPDTQANSWTITPVDIEKAGIADE